MADLKCVCEYCLLWGTKNKENSINVAAFVQDDKFASHWDKMYILFLHLFRLHTWKQTQTQIHETQCYAGAPQQLQSMEQC